MATFVCSSARGLGLGPRFGLVVIDQGRLLWLPRVAIWADFNIFQILSKAGDINNSISMPNYCDEPYGDLAICVSKVRSAWTEVWSGSYRSRSSIMAPGGRDLGRF